MLSLPREASYLSYRCWRHIFTAWWCQSIRWFPMVPVNTAIIARSNRVLVLHTGGRGFTCELIESSPVCCPYQVGLCVCVEDFGVVCLLLNANTVIAFLSCTLNQSQVTEPPRQKTWVGTKEESWWGELCERCLVGDTPHQFITGQGWII